MSLLGVLTVARPDCLAVAERLSSGVTGGAADLRFKLHAGSPAPPGVIALPEAELDPPEPFRGPLFAAVETFALATRARPLAGKPGVGQAAEGCEPDEPALGLVVPARRLDADGRAAGASADAEGLILVLDHVNLALRSPLSGRWPPGRPRIFPSMSGIYQPSGVRLEPDPGIYSRLVVAGVADAEHLSAFELAETRRAGLTTVSDRLVAPVIIAAYYGLAVAAVCVPQATPGPIHHE